MSARILFLASTVLLVFVLGAGSAFAQQFPGAIYTTNSTATAVNFNVYNAGSDVYLSGGPQNLNASGLPDGVYYFQVTDPSGKILLSTDNASCRQLKVTGGRVAGALGGGCAHSNGTLNALNGVLPVQLAPFSPTPNGGGVYKAWLIKQGGSTAISSTDPKVINFTNSSSKTDNFKVAITPPQGSCQPASSLSVMVRGTNVTSYVPKGNWSVTPVKGVSVVNVEGASIVPTLIPTTNVVNSCASNPVTGQTVCTANNTDVYLFSGTSLGSTLTSGGSGQLTFSGGLCTNCGVTMDAVNNKAVVALSIGGAGGFQFLNLATSTFEPAFLSKAPGGIGIPPNISEDILIDPIRSLLLSASERNNYEIVNVATSTSPAFFESPISGINEELDSSGEDCATGIALAPAEFSEPSQIYIADLTQGTFTPGSPGTWTAPSQNQILSESFLDAGASGIAVAQGTHTGIVTGEFFLGSAITAIALPTTSGSGTPAISDWVTCNIGNGFQNGFDPHTVTAYMSPNGGHAIAVIANSGASMLAKVDLTQMLNSTVVPRTVGGHGCASGTLPAAVASFITVP